MSLLEKAGLIEASDSAQISVAAVDLGSNSFHMLVALRRGRDLVVVDRLREPLRLSAGLNDDGVLSVEAQQRALACLERFGQRLSGVRREHVRAVGTNTLRKATNSREFLRQARNALGFPIEIVSGIEEARLIFSGVANDFPADDQRRLVIDIGGGSTEFIIGTGHKPELMESLFMGCVELTSNFFAKGIISRKSMRKAQLHARRELEVIEAAYRKAGWTSVLRASGSIRAVGALCQSLSDEESITRDCLNYLEKEFIQVGNIDELVQLGVSPDRTPVIAGGLAILAATFDALKIKTMTVATGALREGLINDLVGRLEKRDVRATTVAAIAERFRVDNQHAEMVAGTARQLCRAVDKAWSLANSDAELFVDWAARLAEVGLAIAHSQYHKHGAYMIENADLAGFSRQEQSLLAALVRCHRRKFPKHLFTQLDEPWPTLGPRIAVLLRIAMVLHRARGAQPMPNIELVAKEDRLKMVFPAGWLDANPLTAADLEDEGALLANSGIRLVIS